MLKAWFLGAVLLTVSASVGARDTDYPADEILREYFQVCDSHEGRGDGDWADEAVAAWSRNAIASGWEDLSDLPLSGELSRSEWLAKVHIDALNAGLIASHNAPAVIVPPQLFRKRIEERTVFLSLFGMNTHQFPIVECRLHDELLEDFDAPPVSGGEIDRAVGYETSRGVGPFGETVFSWVEQTTEPFSSRPRFVEVHFVPRDRAYWPFGTHGSYQGNQNPYASLGFTLVTGFKPRIVLT